MDPRADGGDYLSHARPDGRRELDRQENGDCIYLNALGCTIYARRPRVCRQFDCRALLVADVREPGHVWEAASAKFAILVKEPNDAPFLAQARARAAYALAHGHTSEVAVQVALS